MINFFGSKKVSSESSQHEANLLAIETAWKIHQAQGEWTNRVDAKAAFAFTIESAALATAVTLTAQDRLFSNISNLWILTIFISGIILLMVGAALAAMVVIPRLREKDSSRESAENFIYFGHARFWSPDRLEEALLHSNILPQIARQITVMSQISWIKHRRVKWSFVCALLGIALLVGVGLALSLGVSTGAELSP